MKTCIACRRELGPENFARDASRPDGLCRKCRSCDASCRRDRYYREHEAEKAKRQRYQERVRAERGPRLCRDCGKPSTSSRHWYCDDCSKRRKQRRNNTRKRHLDLALSDAARESLGMPREQRQGARVQLRNLQTHPHQPATGHSQVRGADRNRSAAAPRSALLRGRGYPRRAPSRNTHVRSLRIPFSSGQLPLLCV